MPRIQLTHKHQTRLNDCWYACIQMIRTWKEGVKTKASGAGVTAHRNRGPLGGGFWGFTLGAGDAEWNNILQQNQLLDVSDSVATNTAHSIQAAVDLHGPLIFGGDFGKVGRVPGTRRHLMTGMGHYIVVVGTSGASDMVHIHDPWHTQGGDMSFQEFRQLVWKADGRTIVANQP